MADDSNPFPSNPIPKITRDDPAAHSGDVIAENIQALRQLFPSIVTDGKIDFDVLRQLLGDELEDSVERYGLNWKGKARARAFALTPSIGTLRPAKEDSKDWDTTKNIVIEGDNLEVLKILRKSYAGKVKLIYIDPPYNTGKDFVYPDNYTNSLANYEVLTGQRGEDGARLTSNKESLLDAASGTSAVPESGVTTTAGSSPATLGPVSWFGWSAVSSSRPDRARGVVHSRGQEWPQAIA